MKYTAEQYLERIENKRLNSTPLYSREEMIDFAEKYAKQLSIHGVSSSNGFTRHSTCCNEEVTVMGELTKYYQCNYCKQPCDTEMLEDEKS